MNGPELAKEIADLRAMRTDELAARYLELHGVEPRLRNREWMLKRTIWKAQERRLGGLSTTAQRRLEELIAEIELPAADDRRTVTGQLRPKGDKPSPAPTTGMTLIREWRGRTYVATVRENGTVEVDGVSHRSLSGAAKAITGAHWNGRLFWGLTKPKGKASTK